MLGTGSRGRKPMRLWPFKVKVGKRMGATARPMVVRGKPGCRRLVEGRFDSAQTTADNRRHWANADHLSANAAGSPEVRRIIRNRARYEVAHNSFARGIVLTLANDVVGTGPRLQMLTPDAEADGEYRRRLGKKVVNGHGIRRRCP